MHLNNIHETPDTEPFRVNQESNAQLPASTLFRGVRLLITALLLAPGVLFGALFLVLWPFNILAGRNIWLTAVAVIYALLQAGSIIAWFRASPTHGWPRLLHWSAVTIVGAVVLISELQRQILEFDGECGNILFGPILMQIAACGTIVGMFLLTFDRFRK